MLIIDVTPTMSKITGIIDQKIFTILMQELSFRDPDFMHKKAFNPHVTERKYLITPSTRVFQTGLLQRVTQFLDLHGLEYQIRDNRIESPPEFFNPIKEDALSLRPYQEEAIRSAITNKCGIIRMATGAGKTFVSSHLVSRLERRTVILVHRIDLLKQFAEVLRGLLHFDAVGICGGGIFEPNIITICTMQTVTYALDIHEDKSEDKKEILNIKKEEVIKLLEDANVVIVDEVHHIVADTFAQVMKKCKNATWRLGLSATDWRDDGADLLIEAAVGPRIFDIGISDLVDKGYLVPANVTVHQQAEPKERCSPKDNWHTLNKCYYTENTNFHHQVLEINREWYDAGRTILTLVTQIKHGVALEKLHNARGIKTVFLSGKDSSEYREKIFNDVRSGKLRHLIGTSIADEGLDLPVIDALNMAGGGKSSVKVYQRIGRTLRNAPGKTHAEVADYKPSVDLLAYHTRKRISIYKHESKFNFKEIR
jgi:superfamily II DNA or RNA helicase